MKMLFSLYKSPVKVSNTARLCYVRQSAIPPPIMCDKLCYRRQYATRLLAGTGILQDQTGPCFRIFCIVLIYSCLIF